MTWLCVSDGIVIVEIFWKLSLKLKIHSRYFIYYRSHNIAATTTIQPLPDARNIFGVKPLEISCRIITIVREWLFNPTYFSAWNRKITYRRKCKILIFFIFISYQSAGSGTHLANQDHQFCFRYAQIKCLDKPCFPIRYGIPVM